MAISQQNAKLETFAKIWVISTDRIWISSQCVERVVACKYSIMGKFGFVIVAVFIVGTIHTFGEHFIQSVNNNLIL